MSNDEIVNNDSNDTEKLSINIDSESFKAPYDFMNVNFKGFFDHIFLNLKIIQSINIEDKLSIDENNIHIDQNCYIQGIIRWWYESSRDKSFIHVEKIILKLLDIHQDLVKQLGYTISTRSKVSTNISKRKRHKMNKYITSIRNELDNTVRGLLNLKKTYNEDSEYKSKTDNLIVKIRNISSKDKTN